MNRLLTSLALASLIAGCQEPRPTIKGRSSNSVESERISNPGEDVRTLVGRESPDTVGGLNAPPLPIRTPVAPPLAEIDVTTFRMASPPLNLDPAFAADVGSMRLLTNLYEGLSRIDSNNKAVPAAATWLQSEDHTVWTFELREDLNWSDGDPITAQDYVDSWRHLVNPEVGSPHGWMLSDLAGVHNAAAIRAGRKPVEKLGIHAKGKRTLVVELDAPMPFFPQLTAFPALYPVHPMVRYTADFDPKNLVSSGPWRIVASRNNVVTIEPSKHHRLRNQIALKQVELHAFEDEDAALTAYETGKLDWTGPLRSGIAASASDFQRDPTMSIVALTLDTNRPPFDDPETCQALSVVLDRDRLAGSVGIAARPATTIVSPSSAPGYASMPVPHPSRPDAEARLAALNKPTIRLRASGSEPGLETLLSALDSAGFKAELAGPDQASNLVLTSWWADYPDPSALLAAWLPGDPAGVGKGITINHEDFRKAVQLSDRNARWTAYARAEAELLTTGRVIPLFHLDDVSLVRPEVEGIRAHALGRHALMDIEKRP